MTKPSFQSPPPGSQVRERGLIRAWGPFLVLAGLTCFVLGAVWRPGFLEGQAGVAALILAAAGLLWSRFRAIRLLQRYERGAEGEERVAAALSRLPAAWKAFHGVPGTRGDLDHVLVGPPGLCVVETIRWNGRVEVRDGRLWDGGEAYPGYELDTLRQRSEAFRDHLGEDAVPVSTFVAVAGGRLTSEQGKMNGIWVGESDELLEAVCALPDAGLSDDAMENLISEMEKRYDR